MLRIFLIVAVMVYLPANEASACMSKYSSDAPAYFDIEDFGSLLVNAALFATLLVAFKAVFYRGRMKIRSYLSVWYVHAMLILSYGGVVAFFTFPRPSKSYYESFRVVGGAVAKIFNLSFIEISHPLSLKDFTYGALCLVIAVSFMPVCAGILEARLLKKDNIGCSVGKMTDVLVANIIIGVLIAAVMIMFSMSQPC